MRERNRKSESPLAEPCKIYQTTSDVTEKLAEFDLAIAELQDVIRHIALTINSQTPDHPSWGTGITVASEAIFALRGRLKEKGWSREEERGFALTAHPHNRIAINIAKGDEGTGDSLASVSTVSDKGICTEHAISENQLALRLPVPDPVTVVNRPTWYLIYCKKSDGIHAEFSLPIGLSAEKHISVWRERIILPITKEDSEIGLTAGFDDGGFEVPVRRKSS
jgi:hypothetical protein